MTQEDLFREWLKKNIFDDCHFQRIENNTSVPDVNVCHMSGVEFWLELKINNVGIGILLRKNQYAWGVRRSVVYKGKCYVLALVVNERDTQEFLGKVPKTIELYSYPLNVEVYGKKYVRIKSQPNKIFKQKKESKQSLLESLLN